MCRRLSFFVIPLRAFQKLFQPVYMLIQIDIVEIVSTILARFYQSAVPEDFQVMGDCGAGKACRCGEGGDADSGSAGFNHSDEQPAAHGVCKRDEQVAACLEQLAGIF